jgi:hypothetical protein
MLAPGLDSERIYHGRRTGLQSAAERRQEVERQPCGRLDQVALVRECIRGERRLAEEVAAHATRGQGIAAVEPLEAEVQVPEVRAIRWPAFRALGTVAARLIGQDDKGHRVSRP